MIVASSQGHARTERSERRAEDTVSSAAYRSLRTERIVYSVCYTEKIVYSVCYRRTERIVYATGL